MLRSRGLLRSRPYSAAATDPDAKPLKRFWKTAQVIRRDDGLVVALDERPLKTAGGHLLLLPHSKLLASAIIAHEWDSQTTVVKPHALPMTSLVSRTLDHMTHAASREQVHQSLVRYLDTDAVCFHNDQPDPLVVQQEKHWMPLLAWARDTFGVNIHVFDSLVVQPQPQQTKEKLLTVLQAMDPWQSAAVERAAGSSKSLIIALALVQRRIDADQAALAAHVEVNSQIERWGEVEDTHDVDYRDIRRQLASAACLLAEDE